MNNYKNISHPWSQQVQTQAYLPMKRNTPFFYMHHPKNWELVYFGTEKNPIPLLLPNLNTLQLDAGINNVREVSKGQVDPNLAIVNMQNSGFTVLDPTKEDYLRVYPAINGKHHADKWTEYEIIGDTVINEFDMKNYNLWRKSLMASGKLELPHKHFISLLLKDYRRKIDKYAKSTHIPQNKTKLSAVSKQMEDIQAFMKKLKKEGRSIYE